MKLGRSSDTHEFPSYYNPIGKNMAYPRKYLGQNTQHIREGIQTLLGVPHAIVGKI